METRIPDRSPNSPLKKFFNNFKNSDEILNLRILSSGKISKSLEQLLKNNQLQMFWGV